MKPSAAKQAFVGSARGRHQLDCMAARGLSLGGSSPAMDQLDAGGAGTEQFEVVGRGADVGVLLGDGLALFGQAEMTGQRAMRQGFEEAVGWAGAAADGATTTVEEDQIGGRALATATSSFWA